MLILKSKPIIFKIDTGRQSDRMLVAGSQKAYSNCYFCHVAEVNCQFDAGSQRASLIVMFLFLARLFVL